MRASGSGDLHHYWISLLLHLQFAHQLCEAIWKCILPLVCWNAGLWERKVTSTSGSLSWSLYSLLGWGLPTTHPQDTGEWGGGENEERNLAFSIQQLLGRDGGWLSSPHHCHPCPPGWDSKWFFLLVLVIFYLFGNRFWICSALWTWHSPKF